MAAPVLPFIWRRTEFDGAAVPYDFMATIDGKGIGRIRRIPHEPQKGCWRWSLTLSVPGVDYQKLEPLHGTAQTKAEAVERIGWAFDIVCNAKQASDLDAGRAPAGVLDHLCSYPGCTHGGFTTPSGQLCYRHAAAARKMAG